MPCFLRSSVYFLDIFCFLIFSLTHHSSAWNFKIGTIHPINTSPWKNIHLALDEWNQANSESKGSLNLALVSPSDTLSSVEGNFCDIIQRGIVAVFVSSATPVNAGGLSQTDSLLLFSMCRRFRIPCLVDKELETNTNPFIVGIGPSYKAIGGAIAQLISQLNWNSFLLLYKSPRELEDISGELFATWHTKISAARTFFKILQIPNRQSDYAPFLKFIRNQFVTRNIVVHTDDLGVIHSLMIQAGRMGMTDSQFSYLFTTLDLHLLETFIIDRNGTFHSQIMGIRLNHDPMLKADFLSSLDVIDVIVEALQGLIQRGQAPETATLLCDAHDWWLDGGLFSDAINTQIKRTGTLHGGSGGNANLNIISRATNGSFFTTGRWNEANSRWKLESAQDNNQFMVSSRVNNDGATEHPNLSGHRLKVVVYLEEPFVMKRRGPNGVVEYDGFCIDLLNQFTQMLNFTYEISEVEDGTYGVEDDNGHWNGIIGVLQRREADLSVSAITITYGRHMVVDFTLPFQHIGITILMHKDVDEGFIASGDHLFLFLEPLGFSVWIALIVAYLSVSTTMWFLAKLSPYEWYNDVVTVARRNKDKSATVPSSSSSTAVRKSIFHNATIPKNQFSLLNSLWFSVGSLMQQGSDVIPRAAATRTVAVIWWLFTLILISSYTAQLAAFLTMERMTTPVESTADLAAQQRIKFGTLRNGSTMDFFRESKIPTISKMWSIMKSSNPTVFVNSSKEGIARVKAGDYAYLMESLMLEYYMGQDCELQTVGGLLDSKGYGIALPKGSILTPVFSKLVLQLQERTVLEALKNKWWKRRRDAQEQQVCHSQKPTHSSLYRVFGIFYVLFTGILVAVLLAVGEFCFESRRNSVRLALTLPGRLINYIYSRNQIDDETNGERPEQCQQQNKVRIQTDSEKIGCKFEDGAVNSRPCELNARTIDQDVFDEAQQLNATRQLPQISEPPGRLRVSFEEPADKPTRKTSDYGLKRKQSFSRGFFRKLQPPSLEMTIDGNTDTLDYYLLPPTDEMLLNRRESSLE